MNEIRHVGRIYFRALKGARRDGSKVPVTGVELRHLMNCLLYEHTRAVSDAGVKPWLERAAEDAASIAWATPYPLLVLPVLLDEKLSEARRKAEVQRSIYVRSQPILALTE